ncbi:hypothetical protein ILUMI_14842 [Ignelater luminosus]|uniref:Peptidase aspartic putative domain-containing protein n=1 Tax=Ignelater luminosus TaxID=2038154 RepID=A0A8K0GA38_IGNLU|nr:hypothetical protein ILUMI_14842 [Ignelater luminosus]
MDTLVRQRGSVKARLTRFEDYVCGIKTKIETNNGVLENYDGIQIRKRLLTIQPLLDTFDQLQLQIENASEDPESESQHITEFEKIYYETISDAENILEKLSSHDNLPAKPSSVVSCHEVLVPGPVAVPSDVLSINGGSQSSSSTGHKGKAAETIKSLAISSANYQIAWDSVNDSITLVHNHIKALFNIEVITKESSPKLRQLIDSVKKNIRALDSLVNEEDQRNAFLIYLINSKLDPTTTREFENKNDSDKFPSYAELISFMEKKASLLETIDQRNQKSYAERLTAKTFVSTVISCSLCKGSHSLNFCERFKQFGLKERSEKAEELKVCYNCLAKNHFTGKCKSRFNCQRCKSRHHTLLHQVESVASVSSAEAEQATVNLSAFGSNQTTVLLSTGVRILDSDGNLHPARALLDSGKKVSWDESLSRGLHNKWLSFRSELVRLNDIKIPRHVVCNNPTRIELHGFADASTFAYGGYLYIRSTNEKNQVFTRLHCSKTRVAPSKTITIPRLELSAALILARLASQVMRAIQINFSKCVLWSDSTVTLDWLKTHPNLLKTFVANRVGEIQEMTEHATWKHVPTNSNPADLLSRGVPLKELANPSL